MSKKDIKKVNFYIYKEKEKVKIIDSVK